VTGHGRLLTDNRRSKFEGKQTLESLDYLVDADQERLRDGEAESFGGLAVDEQLQLRGLLDGQVRRLGALEDLVRLAVSCP
jgi:hypothetical protein